MKDFSQDDFLGTAYSNSCGGVLVGRRLDGSIEVYFKRARGTANVAW